MANNISLSEILHKRPDVVPTIYGYILPDVKDHDGYIKIGYTDRKDTETRIKEQLHTAAINFKILFKESAMRADGTCFTDKDVHRLLKHKGFLQLNEGADKNEWFRCTLSDALTTIEELRTETRFEGNRTWNFAMRDEQKQAVDMTKTYFEQAKRDDPSRPPKFLWNAKMRFGKTFATYELCKAMSFKKILVLTFKPAVESAWQEDISRHVDFKGWKYIGVWERSPEKKRLHFHGIFYIPKGTIPDNVPINDYNLRTQRRQITYQNPYFNSRFGRSDFEEINTDSDLSEMMRYIMKYMEKTGERLVYSKGLPQFFISDIMDEDIAGPIGMEDKKLLLFDDFTCWDEGCYMGKVSPEVIAQMRKVN